MTIEELKDLRECMSMMQQGLSYITYALMQVEIILEEHIQSDEANMNKLKNFSDISDISDIIEDILIKLGISKKRKGFKYLKTAIEMLKENGGDATGIYGKIAKKYNSKYKSVDAAIRLARKDAMMLKTKLYKFIFGEVDEMEMTNISMIKAICEYISR